MEKNIKKKKSFFDYIKKDYELYLFLAPAIIVVLIFKYIPIYGLVMAFQDFNPMDGYAGSEFVGLKHFIDFFNDPFAFRVISNTVILGSLILVVGFAPPIVLALSINELSNMRFKKVVQSISYLPHFVSTVIIVGMLFRLFSVDGGLINSILKILGRDTINFTVLPQWFRPLYILSHLWQSVGWSSILYLAALTGINPELYEAAYVEGANRFRRIWHISIPGIAPTIIILLILNVRVIVNIGLEKVLLMYNPAIYKTADVIATYVYRKGILGSNQSYASAIGFFNSVVALLMVLLVNNVARKVSETSLW